jgi:hypothetical protein
LKSAFCKLQAFIRARMISKSVAQLGHFRC